MAIGHDQQDATPPLWRPRRRRPAIGRVGEGVALIALIALNWYLAASFPSELFSYLSLALFGWLVLLVARISPSGAILLLPLVLTRLSTLASLVVIEAGAYMPEVNRIGAAGDASASFVAVTALFFLLFAALFRPLERPFLKHARSPLLDEAVALLGWPVLAGCVAWGLLALAGGLQTGFPLIAGIDRFLYRRELASPFVLTLLDNKFLVAALLGAIAFAPARAPLRKTAAKLAFVALTGLYFLFGDKAFTIIENLAFFAMPLLLQRRAVLTRTLLRLAPLALAVACASLAATFYIYSDYGRLPLDRTATAVGERIAGQGELWFVATRDDRRLTNWNGHLADRYVAAANAPAPSDAAFASRLETYYFVQRYAPAKLAASFRHNQGWVQLTMGTEAMALVMFGYAGVAVVMAACALLLALAALYLRRAFASGFPLSLFFAVWTYLQVNLAAQQASFWPVAAPGQIKRFLLFAVIELVLLAINRAQVRSQDARMRAVAFDRALHAA